MSVWAIGDLQGCLDATQRLLDAIGFDPAADTLWFCGDLVNRGGQSLETLRLVHSLRDSAHVVLGNHDLSLLAEGERSPQAQERVNPDLRRVVQAEDADELLTWLRTRKLLHADPDLGWMMIHAGMLKTLLNIVVGECFTIRIPSSPAKETRLNFEDGALASAR